MGVLALVAGAVNTSASASRTSHSVRSKTRKQSPRNPLAIKDANGRTVPRLDHGLASEFINGLKKILDLQYKVQLN
jgi:hypothetical protein